MPLSTEASHITVLKPTQPPSWLWIPQMTTALCLILATATCYQHLWTALSLPQAPDPAPEVSCLLFLIPVIASFIIHSAHGFWAQGSTGIDSGPGTSAS